MLMPSKVFLTNSSHPHHLPNTEKVHASALQDFLVKGLVTSMRMQAKSQIAGKALARRLLLVFSRAGQAITCGVATKQRGQPAAL